jgi:hypothetical protein
VAAPSGDSEKCTRIPPQEATRDFPGGSAKLAIILSYQRLTAVAQNIDSGIPNKYGPPGLAGRFPDQVSAGWRDMRMA